MCYPHAATAGEAKDPGPERQPRACPSEQRLPLLLARLETVANTKNGSSPLLNIMGPLCTCHAVCSPPHHFARRPGLYTPGGRRSKLVPEQSLKSGAYSCQSSREAGAFPRLSVAAPTAATHSSLGRRKGPSNACGARLSTIACTTLSAAMGPAENASRS